jgi:hypothetical protein
MAEHLDIRVAERHVVVKHGVVDVGPPETRPDRPGSKSLNAPGGREVQHILVVLKREQKELEEDNKKYVHIMRWSAQ